MRGFVLGMMAVVAAGCQEYQLEDGKGNDLPPTTGGSQTVVQPPTTPVPPGGTTPTNPGGPPDTPRDEQGQTDEIVVPTSLAVDVLWVVDNSSSMGNDQDSLVAEFPTFVDAFTAMDGVDYHIGVISTDMVDPTHDGKLREANGARWIDPATPDPYGTFSGMALLGTNGSGDEAGRAPVFRALTEHLDGHNAGFVREEASLAVIVISDEDDMSDLYGVEIAPFVSFMQAFKPDPALVSFSAIAGPVPDGCLTADPGVGYPEVQNALGGLFWSICDPDWDTVLTTLAANAVGTRREFFLTEIPDVATLEVEVTESDGTSVTLADEGVDFDYDPIRNSVTLLTYVPGPLATVSVHYEVDFGALP